MDIGSAQLVYLLALVPAFLWGITPILDKRGMEADGTALQASLVVVLADLALALVVLVILNGTAAFEGITVATAGLFLVAGLTGTALGRLTVFIGVDRVGASINSAVLSGRPLFGAAFAFGFLGEPISLLTAAGIAVLVAGLVVLSLAKGGDLAGWGPRDLLFPIAAAAFFAGGNVIRRFGLETTSTGPIQAVALNELGALAAFVGYAAVRGRSGFRSAQPWSYAYFTASGVLTAAALFGLFGALSLPAGRVAIVESLASTSPLFTTVFAYFYLKDLERVTVGVVGGALLIVAGAILVTLGPTV